MGDPLYDQDFYLWSQDQAQRLRALEGDNRLDTGNLAEEVADLGRSELNKVASHLYQACAHLLVAAWSPSDAPQGHWRVEIRNHLREARRTFTPGMRQQLDLRPRVGGGLPARRRQAGGLRRSRPAGVDRLPVRVGRPAGREL